MKLLKFIVKRILTMIPVLLISKIEALRDKVRADQE